MHNESHDHKMSFWDALGRVAALKYSAVFIWTSMSLKFIQSFDEGPLRPNQSVREYLARFLTSNYSIGVSLESDLEVIKFVATTLQCIFIIVNVCTDGLGYAILEAIIGQEVALLDSTYYMLVSVDGKLQFDSLSTREYPDDDENEAMRKEAIHKHSINTVVYNYVNELKVLYLKILYILSTLLLFTTIIGYRGSFRRRKFYSGKIKSFNLIFDILLTPRHYYRNQRVLSFKQKQLWMRSKSTFLVKRVKVTAKVKVVMIVRERMKTVWMAKPGMQESK